MSSTDHPMAEFAQTGGVRASKEDLLLFRYEILAIAQKYGYPNKTNQEGRSKFDSDCARWLCSESQLIVGDALRSETWSFLSLVLLPDVCYWRFSQTGLKKIHVIGGAKNLFKRLWRRAFLLAADGGGSDALKYLDILSEDLKIFSGKRSRSLYSFP